VKDAETSVYVTWLHGPAGAGKSAIARSVAESLHREGLLAAAFSFFRTDSRRNSEKPFVPTLAYQIAYSIPETQLKDLLVGPWQQRTRGPKLPLYLIVIDALEGADGLFSFGLFLPPASLTAMGQL